MKIWSMEQTKDLIHPIFLSFYSENLETKYHEFKYEFRQQKLLQIMIISLYGTLVMSRGFGIYESKSKTIPFLFQYEIFWFVLQLTGCILDLLCFYIKCINK